MSSEYPGGIDMALGNGLPFRDICEALELLCGLKPCAMCPSGSLPRICPLVCCCCWCEDEGLGSWWD